MVAAVLFLVLLASPFIYNAFSAPPTHRAELKLPDGGQCVRDTEWMRRNHMKLLMHTRDDVVREGVRLDREGLKGCRSCHPYRGEFCDQCHDYVGMQQECWNCHFYPESKTVINDEDREPGGTP
ncbi:MAG: hypothetical protein HQK87_02770 [Nitrospinae bacterium]|nr:hypothetical protein [Nitrospinota bacterium]